MACVDVNAQKWQFLDVVHMPKLFINSDQTGISIDIIQKPFITFAM